MPSTRNQMFKFLSLMGCFCFRSPYNWWRFFLTQKKRAMQAYVLLSNLCSCPANGRIHSGGLGECNQNSHEKTVSSMALCAWVFGKHCFLKGMPFRWVCAPPAITSLQWWDLASSWDSLFPVPVKCTWLSSTFASFLRSCVLLSLDFILVLWANLMFSRSFCFRLVLL